MKSKKIEFHVHTRFSNDSLLLENLILLMCKIRKINIIAITDHNTIKGAQKIKNKFKKCGIEVIVGEEILTTDGEIIGLFLENDIEPFKTPEETIKEIKNQKGLVYVPHPYDEKRQKTVLKYEKIIKLKDYIDLIESYNGRSIMQEYTDKQNEIAEKLNKIKVVGSDAHVFFEIGRNYMVINENIDLENRDEFVRKISKATFCTKKCIKISHLVTKCVKLIKLIIKGDIDGIYRIIIRKFKRRNKEIS